MDLHVNSWTNMRIASNKIKIIKKKLYKELKKKICSDW